MTLQSNSLSRCKAFIDSNFIEAHPEAPRPPVAVTISRQAYSRSHEIAEELIRLLQADKKLGADTWALFDRDLVHRILEDHHLPQNLARYMPEDKDHDLTGVINEILGVHPSLWKLFHYTSDTILKLAKVGNVILIGRGAHIITRHLPHVFHVRIIAPVEDRVQRLAVINDISHQEAAKQIRQDDAARAAYVRSHFDEDLHDSLAYHLVINSGKTDTRTAARIIFSGLPRD